MVQSTIGRALTDIERAIEAEVRNMTPGHEALTSEVAPAMAMPDYVEHREGATEIGKLSAEARCPRIRKCGKGDRSNGSRLDGSRQAMRDDDPQCARRD